MSDPTLVTTTVTTTTTEATSIPVVNRSVLNHLTTILTTYSPKRVTFDSHVDSYLGSLPGSAVTETVRLIAPSVHRRLPLLHAFADALLAFAPTATLRDDRDLYSLLAWAVLGFSQDLRPRQHKPQEQHKYEEVVRSFINAVAQEKWSAVGVLLDFALHHLDDWVVVEWSKILDIRFIQEKILNCLAVSQSALLALLAHVQSTASLKKTDTAEASVYTTTIVPFNLSTNRTPITTTLTTTPTPVTTSQPKKYSEKLPEKKVIPVTEGQMPHLLSMHRPPRNRSVPEVQMAPVVPRRKVVEKIEPLIHTVTSVLRLHASVVKQQKAEWEEIERYLTELRDSAEYDEWRATMSAADRERDERRVEERKKEAERTRQEAVEAQKRKFEERRHEVKEELTRKEKQKSQLQDERKTELDKMQSLVQEVRKDERVKPLEAVETVKRKNKQEAENLKKIKQEEEARIKLEKEKEISMRKDLISRIRALEKVSVVRPAPFDPSEPPRHGLLEEMSMAELRERLEIANLEHEREIQRRRTNIINDRVNKWQDLKQKWAEVAQVRQQRKLNRLKIM